MPFKVKSIQNIQNFSKLAPVTVTVSVPKDCGVTGSTSNYKKSLMGLPGTTTHFTGIHFKGTLSKQATITVKVGQETVTETFKKGATAQDIKKRFEEAIANTTTLKNNGYVLGDGPSGDVVIVKKLIEGLKRAHLLPREGEVTIAWK